MKKLWFVVAALASLSGNVFADTIWAGSAGSLVNVPTTATFTAATVAYTGGPVNSTNTQTPFWNNPSTDNINSHMANVGNVLAGQATGTNLIGSDLTGGVGGNINGQYFANAGGNGDPVFAGAATVNGSTVSETPALEFSMLSNATSYNIALLFAASVQNTGAAGSGTVFGWYTGGIGSINLHPLNTPTNNTTGTAQALETTTLAPTGFVYGFYATVCYGTVTAGVCSQTVTYTSGAGNYTTNIASNSGLIGGLAWNHFALFQLASGAYVLSFKDYPWAPGNALATEGIGDFNDLIFGLNVNSSLATPEPSTMGIMGLGLAGLALVARRRFAKK